MRIARLDAVKCKAVVSWGKGVRVDQGESRRNNVLGYFLAILQAVLYSTMGIFGKLLYATGLSVYDVVVLRFALTVVLVGAFMLVWRKERFLSRQSAVYVQSVFFFVSAVAYLMAVETLTAGMTCVLFYLFPVVVAIINTVVFHERISAFTIVALFVAIGGLVLVTGVVAGEVVLDAMGVLYAAVSCVAFAIYTVLIQKTGRTEGTFTVTFTLSLVSLVASCVIFPASVPVLFGLDLHQLGLAVGFALLSTILPIVIYIYAIKLIGGTKASLLSISETPSSLLLAYVILGEMLTAGQAVGSVLIICAIVLVTIEPLLQKRARDESAKA